MNEKRDETIVSCESLGFPRTLLAVVTFLVSLWYMWWRLDTLNPETPIFSHLLYAAECFGIFTLTLHLFMVRKLTVREAPLPEPGLTVDVFIPTINEPVDVVRRTAVKAIAMEYPHETYILDDGNREEMRALAEELGCHYLTRDDNQHAKAGNLNNALARSSGDYIALFDADHAPKSNFLMRTLGYFADPKVAFVQTPQDFYNLDSYQHRVARGTGQMWSEQSLFFRVIQRGKDYWNAAFFCGSCAMIRRSALDEIGGFATGTVTEDIHTSIRLHKRGYKSVYHSESLAFGIAPSHMEPFIRQRIRWGQGAMQVWRKEGVIFNRSLTFAQKLNYMASMAIYFDGWQKALYYVTPPIVLLTGWMPIVTGLDDFLIHFLPFFLLSLWCFEELGRGYSEMLFVEQYNMARFAGFCYSTLGLFRNNLKFRVTNKKMAGNRDNSWYLLPQYAVFMFNGLALPASVILYQNYQHLTFHSLMANMVWTLMNLALAGMVLRFSARRGQFRRTNYRFAIPLVSRLTVAPDRTIFASIDDLSCAGMFIMAPRELLLRKDSTFSGTIFLPDGPLSFDAVVRAVHRDRDSATLDALGAEFIWNDSVSRQRMERFLYGSDFEWQLHNLSEMNWTPLSKLSGKENVIRLPVWHKPRTARMSSLVINPTDASPATGIAAVDRRTRRGTLLTFAPLKENSAVDTILLTNEGWRTMRTRVANQNLPVAGNDLSNMYVYQVEGDMTW